MGIPHLHAVRSADVAQTPTGTPSAPLSSAVVSAPGATSFAHNGGFCIDSEGGSSAPLLRAEPNSELLVIRLCASRAQEDAAHGMSETGAQRSEQDADAVSQPNTSVFALPG